MTPNQTIDGVPRASDALKCLTESFRHALQRGIQPSFSMGDLEFFIKTFEELRALLDAPATWLCDTCKVEQPTERVCDVCGAQTKPSAQPQGEQVACMPVERCYDVRAKMIIAFNEAKIVGGDLDDALDAAYKSALRYSPNPLYAEQPAPVAEYDALFIAIGDAVTVKSMGHISISVKAFKERMLRCGLAITSAEQPAPVAVVLPERLPGDDGVCTESHYASGWNTCLDEVTRLNAKSR